MKLPSLYLIKIKFSNKKSRFIEIKLSCQTCVGNLWRFIFKIFSTTRSPHSQTSVWFSVRPLAHQVHDYSLAGKTAETPSYCRSFRRAQS